MYQVLFQALKIYTSVNNNNKKIMPVLNLDSWESQAISKKKTIVYQMKVLGGEIKQGRGFGGTWE